MYSGNRQDATGEIADLRDTRFSRSAGRDTLAPMKNKPAIWRIPAAVRMELLKVARRKKTSVSAVVGTAVKQWLDRNVPKVVSEEEQRLLHKKADRILKKLWAAQSRENRAARSYDNRAVRAAFRKNLGQKYGR
jgi:hypothetical protein